MANLYTNIRINRIDPDKLVLGTPVASLWNSDRVARSKYFVSHLRYIKPLIAIVFQLLIPKKCSTGDTARTFSYHLKPQLGFEHTSVELHQL